MFADEIKSVIEKTDKIASNRIDLKRNCLELRDIKPQKIDSKTSLVV